MGLDMYLYATDGDSMEEVMDWGKSNQIFGWFDRNACGGKIDSESYFDVSRKMLEMLVEDCDKVVADHSLASSLLPTICDSARMGGSEYDRLYFMELERTSKRIREALEYCDDYMPDATFLFCASW